MTDYPRDGAALMRGGRRWRVTGVNPLAGLHGRGALDGRAAPGDPFNMVGVSLPGDGTAEHDEYECRKCRFRVRASRPPQHCGSMMEPVKG